MRLSTKHANQQTITMYDFTGGLNSSISPENIGENQLFNVVNMEPDGASGLLKTVAGTRNVFTVPFEIYSAYYDKINKKFILISKEGTERKIYAVSSNNPSRESLGTSLATLSGDLKPIYTLWEDGVLIASGGKLQYFSGDSIQTISKSPDKCSGVYVRNGRVLVADTTKNKIVYSAVGDEENWDEATNDTSSSKWVETGYKDGGNFIGMVNLSDAIIIFKDNGYVYRLTGNFPDWNMQEISRQLDCGGRMSFCSLTNTVLVLGQYNLQMLDTTQDYSDIKAGSVSIQVANRLQQMPQDAQVVYVPPLNQAWIIGDNGFVLIYSTTYKSFFTRQFNSEIVTVFSNENDVFIVKKHGIYALYDGSFEDSIDDGSFTNLAWSFTSRRMVSNHEYLLKKFQINVSPAFNDAEKDSISIGRIKLNIPTKTKYADDSEFIYDNDTLIYNNIAKIYPEVAMSSTIKCVQRTRALTIKGNGRHGRLVINSIKLDVAEV